MKTISKKDLLPLIQERIPGNVARDMVDILFRLLKTEGCETIYLVRKKRLLFSGRIRPSFVIDRLSLLYTREIAKNAVNELLTILADNLTEGKVNFWGVGQTKIKRI